MTEVRDKNAEAEALLLVVEKRNFALNFAWRHASPLAYFRDVTDGLRLYFARGTNRRAILIYELRGSASIVEGDVIMSRDRAETFPIMSRMDAYAFEMSLDTWLDTVEAQGEKGIMLHFQTDDVLVPSLELIKRSRILGPKILSANIFRAEEDAPEPMDPKNFLRKCKSWCPNDILCLGWEADIADMISRGVGYSEDCLRDAAKLLARLGVTSHVMFSMHAVILKRSIDVVQHLLDSVPNSSLYVWSNEQNPIDGIDDLAVIREAYDVGRVFYSIPPRQLKIVNFPLVDSNSPVVPLMYTIRAFFF